MFHAKSCKLYGRKLIDVEDNGDYVLGEWKLLKENDLHAGVEWEFSIDGTYVQYAFSCDVTWGTDFPYSGIFWNDIERSWADDIHITLNGFVRNVDVRIEVGESVPVNEKNCYAHKEWKPT